MPRTRPAYEKDLRQISNLAAAERAVFEFIEGWYNPHRRHSALNYLSPLEYEKKHLGVV